MFGIFISLVLILIKITIIIIMVIIISSEIGLDRTKIF